MHTRHPPGGEGEANTGVGVAGTGGTGEVRIGGAGEVGTGGTGKVGTGGAGEVPAHLPQMAAQ